MNKTETKLVARSTVTGLYFDGRAFNEASADKALALRPGTTAESFGLSWAGGVEVVTVGGRLERKSFAQRIHAGEMDEYGAAYEYVIERQKAGQKSFSVRVADGKYMSRVAYVQKTGPARQAWVKYGHGQCALRWSMGELAIG